MTFEETRSAALDVKIGPLRAQLELLTEEIAALRRALPPLSTVRRKVRSGEFVTKRLGKVLRDLSALHPSGGAP